MTIDFASLKSVLYSAVLSDVLDAFGRRNQAMKPYVRPLDEDLVVFGRARTGLYMNTYSVADGEKLASQTRWMSGRSAAQRRARAKSLADSTRRARLA